MTTSTSGVPACGGTSGARALTRHRGARPSISLARSSLRTRWFASHGPSTLSRNRRSSRCDPAGGARPCVRRRRCCPGTTTASRLPSASPHPGRVGPSGTGRQPPGSRRGRVGPRSVPAGARQGQKISALRGRRWAFSTVAGGWGRIFFRLSGCFSDYIELLADEWRIRRSHVIGSTRAGIKIRP